MADLEPIQHNHQLARLQSLSRYFLFSLSGQVALYYMLALTLAEVIITQFAPWPGLALHGLILVVLLLHASLVAHLRQRRFLLTLSLLPLIRLLSLSMPLALFPIIYRYVVIGVPLFIAVLITARTAGLDRSRTGLTLRTIPLQILVGLAGIGLGYLEYWILRPAPVVSDLNWKLTWLPALILLVFTGFLEELIFRGVLQYAALNRLGRYGFPYVAVLYAVFNLGYHSVLNILFVFCVALAFGIIAARSGSILGVSLSHGLANIFLYLVFPFLFGI